MSDKKTCYDLAVSFGNSCKSAECLRWMNMRSESGPFDWVSGENDSLRKNTEMLLRHFEGFVANEDDFKFLEMRSGDMGVCVNKKTSYLFPHDFVCKDGKIMNFPEVREKYVRRFARFIKHLENPDEKILFVFFRAKHLIRRWGRYFNSLEYSSVDEVKECLAKLNEAFPAQIDMIYINPERDRPLKLEYGDDSLKYYTGNCLCEKNGELENHRKIQNFR